MSFGPKIIVQDVATFFPMVWAILRGKHKMPWATLLWALVCMVYFVSPIDALPDVLPALGIADDGAFIVWILVRLHQDLENYRNSKTEKPTIVMEAEITNKNKTDR